MSRTARTSTSSLRTGHWPSTLRPAAGCGATNEFTSFAFFKTFGRIALTRNADFDLEWRDPSGEAIAVWGKRGSEFASNIVRVGENVLVEISDSHGRGHGLRLLKIPDALKQGLSVR